MAFLDIAGIPRLGGIGTGNGQFGRVDTAEQQSSHNPRHRQRASFGAPGFKQSSRSTWLLVVKIKSIIQT
ncbi:hypothetical protein [Paenibacillus lautus]|uniref:hypothetical protein n=1 Tax=Paenibacillus lautus TaxID=1401 RepID=UPI003D2B2BD8